jgi:hypothetical protein
MHIGQDQSFELKFPVQRMVKDRGEVTIRPAGEADEELLLAFYRSLPPESRLRLRQDATNRAILKRFLEGVGIRNTIILAALVDEGKSVVGEVTLRVQHHGWMRHVGEIRYCLNPDWSPTSLAEHLIMEICEVGAQQGLDKLFYLVLDDQTRLRKMLEDLGFRQEAELLNHATDLVGKKHNVYVMSNHIADLWRQMEDMILGLEERSYT